MCWNMGFLPNAIVCSAVTCAVFWLSYAACAVRRGAVLCQLHLCACVLCKRGDGVQHLPARFILTAGAWSLQVIVSRMRTISSQLVESQAAPVRIVGLCTSLANAKDLGEWIGASSHGLYNFPPGRPIHP